MGCFTVGGVAQEPSRAGQKEVVRFAVPRPKCQSIGVRNQQAVHGGGPLPFTREPIKCKGNVRGKARSRNAQRVQLHGRRQPSQADNRHYRHENHYDNQLDKRQPREWSCSAADTSDDGVSDRSLHVAAPYHKPRVPVASRGRDRRLRVSHSYQLYSLTTDRRVTRTRVPLTITIMRLNAGLMLGETVTLTFVPATFVTETVSVNPA